MSSRGEPGPPASAAWSGAPLRKGLDVLALLLPSALTLFLAFRAGGYFSTETAVAAAVAIAGASVLLLFRRPGSLKTRQFVVVAGAMASLGAWALLSALWSPQPGRAETDGLRVFLYLGVLLVAGSLALHRERRWLLRLLTSSMVLVGLAAFLARALPDLFPVAVDLDAFGLNYPLTYANALGLLMAAAVVLCFFLTTAEDEPLLYRAVAAAAIPVLVSTLALTLSRGAAIGCCVALAVYMLVSRRRDLVPGLVATLPHALLSLAATLDAERLATADATTSQAVGQGRLVALVVLFSSVNAGVLRALVSRTALARAWPATERRLAVVAVISALGVGFFLSVAVVAASETPSPVGGGATETLQSRSQYWRAALRGFKDEPVRGVGAGAFSSIWAAHGTTPGRVRDAHSLYVEVPAELGLVGAALLLTALITIVAQLGRLAAASSDPAFAAMFAVGLLWVATAAFEWTWEMPAATVWFFAVGGLALGSATELRQGLRRAAPP